MRRSLRLALLASLAGPGSAAALSFSDAFDGGSLDPFYWEVSSTNATAVDVSTGRVVLTQMGGAGTTRVTFAHPLAGDYSVTIDFELVNWPANNLERVGLLVDQYGAAERLSDSGFGSEIYLSDLRPLGVLSPAIPTTDTSGSLRMARTGTQVCASYFDGAAFQDLQCFDDPAAPDATFYFMMWRDFGGGDGVQVAFDGFELEAPDAGFCGDGVEEGPETCDDGNTAAGDGCDASCQDEGASSSCALAPILACTSAGKASLSVVESKPGKEKLKLALKKLASAVALADLGDPVAGATRYDVCVYDGANQLAGALSVDRAGQTCGSKPCWKASGSTGFKYKDPNAAASGVRSLKLKSGDAGKGSVSLQAGNQAAKGQTALPTGIAAALQGATSATVQVLTDVSSCFAADLGTVKKADGSRFQASSP